MVREFVGAKLDPEVIGRMDVFGARVGRTRSSAIEGFCRGGVNAANLAIASGGKIKGWLWAALIDAASGVFCDDDEEDFDFSPADQEQLEAQDYALKLESLVEYVSRPVTTADLEAVTLAFWHRMPKRLRETLRSELDGALAI